MEVSNRVVFLIHLIRDFSFISENLFIDMADRLSEDGWRELGYVYVNIDDCWSSMQRDEKGRLQADPKR